MEPSALRLGIATLLAVGLGAAVFAFPGGVPIVARFAFAVGVLFLLGRPLQIHSARQLRRGRFDLRTGIWTLACFAFMYSTLVWIWWNQRGLYFPPRLLNRDLQVSYFFELAMALVAGGLYLARRLAKREARD